MTGHLNRLYARSQDMRAAMRVLDQQIADEERRQSEALGYRMILRGPQLLEAMGRNVA